MAAGHVWQGGMCGRGVCMAGGLCMAREMATASDGMHPTGMHSFFKLFKLVFVPIYSRIFR